MNATTTTNTKIRVISDNIENNTTVINILYNTIIMQEMKSLGSTLLRNYVEKPCKETTSEEGIEGGRELVSF